MGFGYKQGFFGGEKIVIFPFVQSPELHGLLVKEHIAKIAVVLWMWVLALLLVVFVLVPLSAHAVYE